MLNEMSESPDKDSAALTKAITAQAKFFNKMSLDKKLLPPRRMLAQLPPDEQPRLPNQRQRLIGTSKIYNLESNYQRYMPHNNPYNFLGRGRMGNNSNLKKNKNADYIDKEELRD